MNREIVGEVSDEDANRSSAISSGSLAFSGQTWGLIAVEAMEVGNWPLGGRYMRSPKVWLVIFGGGMGVRMRVLAVENLK